MGRMSCAILPLLLIAIIGLRLSDGASISADLELLEPHEHDGLSFAPSLFDLVRRKRDSQCNALCTYVTGCHPPCVCEWLAGVCLRGANLKETD